MGAPGLDGDRIRIPGPRGLQLFGRAVRATLAGAGAFALCVCVLLGALLQVGVVQCALCDGNVCGPGVEVCPGSALGLGLVIGLLAGFSLMTAVGVSGWEVRRRAEAGTSATPSPLPPRPTALLSPFLAFLGGSSVVLGWLLPMPGFGTCHYGPCVYPYVLSGYPEMLVIGGTAALASAAALFCVHRFGGRGPRTEFGPGARGLRGRG